MPNLLSPVSKTAKAGGKAAFKIANLILRAATLILIAIIFCLLAVNFWKNYGAFGSIATAVAEKNYALAAYAAVAVFLLLFELITFFRVLSGSKKSGRKGPLRGHRQRPVLIPAYLCWFLAVRLILRTDPGLAAANDGHVITFAHFFPYSFAAGVGGILHLF